MSETAPPSLEESVEEPAVEPEPRRTRPLRRLALDTAYVGSGFVLGIAGFVVAVAGLGAGVGLLVVWLGLGVLVGTVLVARGLAHVERRRLRTLLGREVPEIAYVVAPAGAGWLRRMLTPLRDPQSWLDVLWALVSFVTGTAGFTVLVAWWATTLGGLSYWVWQRWLPEDDDLLVEQLGWGHGQREESLLVLGIGVAALLTLPIVAQVAALVHAGVADALLVTRGRLRDEPARPQ